MESIRACPCPAQPATTYRRREAVLNTFLRRAARPGQTFHSGTVLRGRPVRRTTAIISGTFSTIDSSTEIESTKSFVLPSVADTECSAFFIRANRLRRVAPSLAKLAPPPDRPVESVRGRRLIVRLINIARNTFRLNAARRRATADSAPHHHRRAPPPRQPKARDGVMNFGSSPPVAFAIEMNRRDANALSCSCRVRRPCRTARRPPRPIVTMLDDRHPPCCS